MINKIIIKKCPRHWWHHEMYNVPNPEYFISRDTNKGTTIYYCKKCYEILQRNLEYYKEQKKIEKRKKELYDKKNLVDHYVIKELLKGTKNLNPKKIPKILINMKRMTIKLKQLIEKKKLPLLECVKHGNLYIKDVIKSGKNRTGEQRYKCRECMKDIHRNHYINNKEDILRKQAEYRNLNKERRKIIKAKSWRKCNGKNNEYGTTKRSSS